MRIWEDVSLRNITDGMFFFDLVTSAFILAPRLKNNTTNTLLKKKKNMSITKESELTGMRKASEAVTLTLKEMRKFSLRTPAGKEVFYLANDMG